MSATSTFQFAAERSGPTTMYGQLRKVHVEAGADRLRLVVEDVVAGVFDIQPHLLRLGTRGRANVALARQVAMYIAHVSYGLSLTEVGQAFERDRTTVAHACGVVEYRREDPQFDEAITLIERIIRAMCGAGGMIENAPPATSGGSLLR